MKRKKTKQTAVSYISANRGLARAVARAQCKLAGMVHVCKGTNKKGKKRESWFSNNWRFVYSMKKGPAAV